MQSLASRLYPDSTWRHAGDLAWAAGAADKSEQCPTAVWREDDRVVAWGWLEGPGDLTIQVDPHHPALAHEVLAWAEQTYPDSAVSATISENEPHVAAALTARGYRAATDGPFFACLGRDLATLPAPPALPDGYTLHACNAQNIATRAEAHRAAWSDRKSVV